MFRALILSTFLFLHPLHVTLISLNKEAGSDGITILFRMYYDDFLLDYKLYQPEFEPEKIIEATDYFRQLIGDYFNERVQIYVNGKLIPGKVLELSVSNYEVLMSLSYAYATDVKDLRIRNRVLTGIYSDQTNMVYLNVDNYENAFKLTPEKPEVTVRLK